MPIHHGKGVKPYGPESKGERPYGPPRTPAKDLLDPNRATLGDCNAALSTLLGRERDQDGLFGYAHDNGSARYELRATGQQGQYKDGRDMQALDRFAPHLDAAHSKSDRQALMHKPGRFDDSVPFIKRTVKVRDVRTLAEAVNNFAKDQGRPR